MAMQVTRALAVAGLALAGWITSVTEAQAQNRPADLTVEFVFIPLVGSDRVLAIDVTNVGEGWAEATTLRVESVSPGPATPRTLNVRSLGANQRERLTYTLASDCNGHVVKAEAPATRSVTGQAELNLANNQVQQQVCPPLSAPKPGGVGLEIHRNTGPITAPPAGIEVERRAIPVAAEMVPIKAASLREHSEAGACEEPLASMLIVGWAQHEDECGVMGQTAFLFDLSKLPEAGVESAVLAFRETAVEWLDGDGRPTLDKQSCAVKLGLATRDWASQPARASRFPAEVVQSNIPFGAREWAVTEELNRWLDGSRPNHGFVLMGQFDELEATETSACLSRINDVTLKIQYWGAP